VRDRRPDRHEDRHRVLQGACQAAREPDLGRRVPVRLRLARRDVAGRGRAAAARRPLRRRRGQGMSLSLVLAATLALLAALAVARPFLREPAPASDRLDELGEEERRRLELAEERDRALAALKELEFDHRTGKVSDEHYRE